MTSRLVRLQREHFDSSPWYGFIVSESDPLLVLQIVSDRYDLDGYCVVRRADVGAIDGDFERADFIRRALRLKGQQPTVPRVAAMTSMPAMMESIQREYGLLTIHRESVTQTECEIGQIRMSSEDTYVLHWLDPDARWDLDDRPFRYRDVTRIDFDREYERILLLVAKDREEEA
jgi:hypothetical protein